MFINTTLEKTIHFTLFTELLIKDLWTGEPQRLEIRQKDVKMAKKESGKNSKKKKKNKAGNGMSKPRARVH